MSMLPMFGPYPGDTVEELTFKLKMVNAFGIAGVGTEAERDTVVSALRMKLLSHEPAFEVVPLPGKPSHGWEFTKDYGDQ